MITAEEDCNKKHKVNDRSLQISMLTAFDPSHGLLIGTGQNHNIRVPTRQGKVREI